MPYVKSIPIRATVQKSLNYILNPDKTEGLLYTSSMNCMTSAKDAYLEMKSVFESFSTEKDNAPLPIDGKGSVKAIHYIQSFDPRDNLSPELAHRIAKAFARKTFGDDCQVVIATHVDKGHVHSHLIVNTYTLTGRKLNDNQATLKHIREYSDRVCLAFGIQPFDKSKGKGKTITHHEWEHKKNGTSWKQKLQMEIDVLIGSVKNLDELLYELELKGYWKAKSSGFFYSVLPKSIESRICHHLSFLLNVITAWHIKPNIREKQPPPNSDAPHPAPDIVIKPPTKKIPMPRNIPTP